MQLDINQSFASQISPLQGRRFENIVASCYYYLGYYVNRNLTVRFSKQTAAEIDVLASLITPLNELRIAIECKGQTPSFNDLRKFSTVKTIIGNDNIELDLVAYGANDIRAEHLQFSKLLDINLLKKDDLSKTVLPILWGNGQLVQQRIGWINRYMAIFTIQDYFLDNVYSNITIPDVKKEFGEYIRFLYSDLWSVKDPVMQINLAFDGAQNKFNGFTDKVARRYGSTANNQANYPNIPEVQLAMFLELEHRTFNLVGIARCSILARSQNGRNIITERTPAIREALNTLCEYNMSITKFCTFIYRWIYLWGGVTLKQHNFQEVEYSCIANECGISVENVKQFIQVLRDIYSMGNNLFYVDANKEFFKYVPAPFRALGKIHRNSTNQEYTGLNLFTEDSRNLVMLNNSLASIGGSNGLRFQ